jgi:hypothetical protein
MATGFIRKSALVASALKMQFLTGFSNITKIISYISADSFEKTGVKGTVQRDLMGVKSGIN